MKKFVLVFRNIFLPRHLDTPWHRAYHLLAYHLSFFGHNINPMGTATENVSILDEAFYFPSLERHRRIWVYLPTGYHESQEHYPVIYMQDGQNLFDESNAFGEEWRVDETLDTENGKVIVIGIDNGGEHRMTEYMWHDHPEYGNAEGERYIHDVVNFLKPWIDQTLRTLPAREHTCIAGSSMGGLISLYAGLHFANIFGSVGIFSPSLWVHSDTVFLETREVLSMNCAAADNEIFQRWYFYGGARESETLIPEIATLVKTFREYSCIDCTYELDATGIHDETVWRNYFPNFYNWFRGLVSGDELQKRSDIKVD